MASKSKNRGRIKCFVPNGRSEYCIYLLSLREHTGVVKIGRTSKWKSRKNEYENWNLAQGDGIENLTRFLVTDEFVDLGALEGFIIEALSSKFKIKSGSEWFQAEYSEALSLVEMALSETGLTYDTV